MTKVKPIYEVAINLETEQEFQDGISEAEEKKKEEFARYVDDLKQKLSQKAITPEQYRELT